jgi:hypothetical protein
MSVIFEKYQKDLLLIIRQIDVLIDNPFLLNDKANVHMVKTKKHNQLYQQIGFNVYVAFQELYLN